MDGTRNFLRVPSGPFCVLALAGIMNMMLGDSWTTELSQLLLDEAAVGDDSPGFVDEVVVLGPEVGRAAVEDHFLKLESVDHPADLLVFPESAISRPFEAHLAASLDDARSHRLEALEQAVEKLM
jgi:hypothetical protein